MQKCHEMLQINSQRGPALNMQSCTEQIINWLRGIIYYQHHRTHHYFPKDLLGRRNPYATHPRHYYQIILKKDGIAAREDD